MCDLGVVMYDEGDGAYEGGGVWILCDGSRSDVRSHWGRKVISLSFHGCFA